jgi:hypothetical protein
VNINAFFFKSYPANQKLFDFLHTQDTWMRKKIETDSSAYWKGMGLILAQYDGMVAGYDKIADESRVIFL